MSPVGEMVLPEANEFENQIRHYARAQRRSDGGAESGQRGDDILQLPAEEPASSYIRSRLYQGPASIEEEKLPDGKTEHPGQRRSESAEPRQKLGNQQ